MLGSLIKLVRSDLNRRQKIKKLIDGFMSRLVRLHKFIQGKSPRYTRAMRYVATSFVAAIGVASQTHGSNKITISEPEIPYFDRNLFEVSRSGNSPIETTNHHRTIQVFRRNALGDVLLATPVLQKLREKYPESDITFSTGYPEILENNPYIDRLVKTLEPLSGYDLDIMLNYELTPERHIMDSYDENAGVKTQDRTPEVFVTDEERKIAAKLLRDVGVDIWRPICGFHMESGWAVRDWPFEKFLYVAEQLQESGIQVLLLGTTANRVIRGAFDLRGRTSTRILAAVISKCTALLTVDSALMHIATAFRKPVVSLFGCTNPEKRLPTWAMKTALYSEVICRGCHHRQRPLPVTTPPACPWDIVICMESIKAENVSVLLMKTMREAIDPSVSIIVIHDGGFSNINSCVQSILISGCKQAFEVIVVGSFSVEERDAIIESWTPELQVFVSDGSDFAQSLKRGVAAARGNIIAILRSEILVSQGWIDALVQELEADKQIGVVGPKILYSNQEMINHCGVCVDDEGNSQDLFHLLPASFESAQKPRYFFAVAGDCLIMWKTDFEAISQLDDNFGSSHRLYLIDLCLKLKAASKHILFTPKAVVQTRRDLPVESGTLVADYSPELFELFREKWRELLIPDITAHCQLGQINSLENTAWESLDVVSPAIVDKHKDELLWWTNLIPPYKIEIGSGFHPEPGFIHLDIMDKAPHLDIRHDISKPLPFSPNTVCEILANHVIEHLSWRKLPELVSEMLRVLILGGTVKLRTPNLQFIANCYLSGRITPEHPDDEFAIRALYGNLTPGLWANIKLFSGQDYPSNYHSLCMDPDDLVALFISRGFAEAKAEPFGREFSPGEIQLVAIK